MADPTDLWCGTELVLDGSPWAHRCDYQAQHPGMPHRLMTCPPCPRCWGLDSHADTCPALGVTTSELLFLEFTDQGAYWASNVQEYVTDPSLAARPQVKS